MRAAQQYLGNALVSKPRQQRPCGAQRAVVAQAATQQVTRRPVPLELEKGDLPMNTFSPKKPFKATVKSVERIVGPKATGETCHIIVETRGEIPFWEGQSYGIIPPVGALCGLCLPRAYLWLLLGMREGLAVADVELKHALVWAGACLQPAGLRQYAGAGRARR